ncbi:uracil-DNA glycosylase-like protein [Lipomyces tetrasporus]|uniref:Uracil-DNA glycosylase-like protein n=1 Tax=Lipomyces tetrasporus TaxID=54092 RepID=A0AAD7QLB6_9ASCO|nr:uracil-DNA glycosylase-like protein [Lipomyces tetrasporus]KAJ8096951.1 uracil-DNA glycosylase-like protein [Lipomyces tetrasporus]
MSDRELDLGTKPLQDEVISELTRPISFNGKLEQYCYPRPSEKNGRTPFAQDLTPTMRSATKRMFEEVHTHRVTRSSKSRYFSAASSVVSSPRKGRSTASSPGLRNNGNVATGSSLPNNLRDSIPHNLILLLVGLNPGIMTGVTGWAYAHPSNLYWKLLHSSAITSIRHPPSDTYRLPELYSVGNTNIVSRPTKNGGQLSRREMDDGVPILEQKVREKKPEAVAIVGKSIWESIWRVRKGRAILKEEFHYGWQDESENMGRINGRVGNEAEWKGARVFVTTTTSGLAAGMRPEEKEAVWKVLGSWVKERREQRKRVEEERGLSIDEIG